MDWLLIKYVFSSTKTLSIDYFASFGIQSLATAGEELIDQSTGFERPALSVPRERGVRGAARGLEREGKGIGATHEKAQW
jgi:hypothetical protein